MKIDRVQNASRNVFFGIIFKIFSTVMPFVTRTVMIYYMGAKYLGLDGLFTSVLQVLNLAELGVGNAMIFSMYKPIAEDDSKTICALMNLYRKYYRIIGAVIGIGGLALSPFIPHLVKDTIPNELNLYILYLMNLGVTVFSYWLYAYKNSLLIAYQRDDISSKIAMSVMLFKYIAQCLVVFLTHNYYLYLFLTLISQIIVNIVTSITVSKLFPEYKPEGVLPKEEEQSINHRIRDVFTMKLGGTIVGSADTIVISSFLGLTVLYAYQNYYFIMNALLGFITIFFSATIAGIGNGLVVDTPEKNYQNYRKFTFIISWIATVGTVCLAGLFQRFIKIWAGEEALFGNGVMLLFCLYFYLFVIQQMTCVYKDAGGIWHSDRLRPLTAGLFNLAMNLLFVEFWGIYAIVLSTVCSYLFVAMPWLIYNVFDLIFKRSPKEFVGFLIKHFVLTILLALLCFRIAFLVPYSGFVGLVICVVICVFISNVAMVLIYRKTDVYRSMLDLVRGVLEDKILAVKKRFIKQL